jgi:hypothetical protein
MGVPEADEMAATFQTFFNQLKPFQQLPMEWQA